MIMLMLTRLRTPMRMAPVLSRMQPQSQAEMDSLVRQFEEICEGQRRLMTP